MRNRKGALFLVVAAALSSLSLVSCNINLFSPFDSPSGDTQLISAARACFDSGDFACAQKNYAKVSSSNADIANSESAYLQLTQAGVPMAAFISAFGNSLSNPGQAITGMANYILANSGASAAKRAEIIAAYKQANQVTPNTSLSGLAHFVTAMGLISEVMAEGAGTETTLTAANMVGNPQSCINDGGPPACILDAACAPPSQDVFSRGACSNLPDTSPFDTTGFTNYADFSATTPDFCMVDASVQAIVGALGELGSGGSNTGGFASALKVENALLSAANGPAYGCYRSLLLSQGIGFTQ